MQRRPDSDAEQHRGEDNADGRKHENPHYLMAQITRVELQASGKQQQRHQAAEKGLRQVSVRDAQSQALVQRGPESHVRAYDHHHQQQRAQQ